MEEFKNVISLGDQCLVAGNLARYGLRSFSGPFDWVTAEKYETVISMIEEDFKNYLRKENLEKIPDLEYYRDIKYKILFNHDNMYTQKDYESCFAKYQRRIERFQKAVKEKTLFVRVLRTQDDVDYAVKEHEYILEVLRKSCPENEVVYIVRKSLGTEENRRLPIRIFVLGADVGADVKMSGREWIANAFKTNGELENFFNNDILFSEIKRHENMFFGLKSNCEKLERTEKRYHMLIKIDKTDFSKIKLPTEAAIYGAGNIGRFLYEKIKNMTTVKCFIDSKAGWKPHIDEIPIVIPSEYSYAENLPVIIAVTYDYEQIVDDLRNIYHVKGEIISLDELLG